MILFTESYQIIAIFTLKDGKAVMLDHFYGDRYAWIDEQGDIHLHYLMSANFDRSNESYLFRIVDGALQAQIAIGYWNNELMQRQYYRLENGERVSITEQEWETLDATVRNTPHGWTAEQYTATRAGLPVERLFVRTPSVDGLQGKEYVREGFFTLSDESDLRILAVSENQIRFEMNYVKYDENDEFQVSRRETLTFTATLTDSGYVFQTDAVSGKLDFGVNRVFVVFETSADPIYDCTTFIFIRYDE